MSDYYFNKWKKTLETITNVINIDLDYQETKAHDKQICDTVQKLTGMLGSYIVCYNNSLDCLNHNLQIQKTVYIVDIVNNIEGRILELKDQLRKLEGAYFQSMSNGLIERKMTPYDAEFLDISRKYNRSISIKINVEEALRNAKERKDREIADFENATLDQKSLEIVNWWENNEQTDKKEQVGFSFTEVYEVKEKISEETLKRREIIAMIQAHEKSRQVIRNVTYQKQRRVIWEKELKGILRPQAPFELKEKSARLIQQVFRFYFELKRRKITDCKREELLGLNYCNKPNRQQFEKDEEDISKYSKLYAYYQEQRKNDSETFKQKFLNRKRDDIAEEFQDNIRDWFRKWYDEVNFFHDIPKENQGGIALIIKEDIISPSEWIVQYENYLETKKANKNKTSLQIKWEKLEARKEEMMLRREELKKEKLEAELRKKFMKNPTLHPGYHYPSSNKTEQILTAIKKYQKCWDDIDNVAGFEAKEKYVESLNQEDICKEVKLEICQSINAEMRKELKILKKALKEDYKRNGQKMPEHFQKKVKRKKRQRKVKTKTSFNVQDKLNNLALTGYLKDFPKIFPGDFIGDINYAGADLRCHLQSAEPFGGDVREVWWEKYRDVIHGHKRILLVGPNGSGKTTLVHILATVNDAIVYQLDPYDIGIENINTDYLQELINSIATCAKFTHPSVIYIRHVESLYYRKVPPDQSYRNFDLIKRYFIRKLFKKLHKNDNITVIGSCTEPWLCKSKLMLKKFTSILLMPETNYSVIHLILRKWTVNNRIVPYNFDIQTLAHMLRGYPFGYVVRKLNDFLTADRIVNIAAFGLTVQDVHNYFLEDQNQLIDYEKYLKWYTDKTHWGRLETKQLKERREFKLLVEKWKEKIEKKKQDYFLRLREY